MEALASFGGSDFASMPVRKIDLKKRLKREAEEMKKEQEKEAGEEGPPQPKRPRTRYGMYVCIYCPERCPDFRRIVSLLIHVRI